MLSRNQIGSVAAAVVLAFCLAGCGGQAEVEVKRGYDKDIDKLLDRLTASRARQRRDAILELLNAYNAGALEEAVDEERMAKLKIQLGMLKSNDESDVRQAAVKLLKALRAGEPDPDAPDA